MDKCCTIAERLLTNTGLNPVAELNYGKTISRALIHFNTTDIAEMVKEKEIIDLAKAKHILKLTNCASINNDMEATLIGPSCERKYRASSFDVIIFKLPDEWDNGRGVDFTSDIWENRNKVISTEGCTWYNRVNGAKWDNPGIYSLTELSFAYDEFSEGKDSIVIARQHFDIGNENFEFDITDYVNKVISGEEKNYGLGIAFSPMTENIVLEENRYIGFFGPNTHTFFQPYMETTYDNTIEDDRSEFRIGKTNRLFLYCHEDGEFFNLDEMPVCEIDGLDMKPTVKQLRKGVYYAEFSIEKGAVEPNTILYDKWSNLAFNGVNLGEQEFEFVALEEKNLFSNKRSSNGSYVPNIFGINDDENLEVGEMRRISLSFRKKYTTNEYKTVKDAYYRIYVKEGDKEINVIDYQKIDRTFLENYFTVDTTDLMPNRYYVDIKYKDKYFKDILRFNVVNNITNRYI